MTGLVKAYVYAMYNVDVTHQKYEVVTTFRGFMIPEDFVRSTNMS